MVAAAAPEEEISSCRSRLRRNHREPPVLMPPPIFFGNLTFVLATLVVFGACGWFAVAPFKRDLPYAVLVAPFAGLLLLVLATLGGYVFLQLPMRQAGLAGLGAAVGLSLLAMDWTGPRGSGRKGLLLACLGLAVGVIVVRLTTATSLQFNEAAMLNADGTDHLGYAHLADWLNDHPVTVRPVWNAGSPYDSWPNLLLQIDPRFGSHTLLALMAQASGHSAMFAYDLTGAVVLATTVLAVAGVYARSMRTLWLLAAGLLVSHWFDYGRSGYLGKTLGYPGALVVAGLYLTAAARAIRVADLISVAALAAAAALMHSGLPLALLAGLIGGSYLSSRLWCGWQDGGRLNLGETRDQAISLGLVVAAALLAGGTLARPLVTGFPDWNLSWHYILPRITDLESQGVPVSGLAPAWLEGLAWGLLGIGVAGGLLAAVCRVPAAIALLLGPLLLLGALYGLGAKAVTFQLIGTFFPLGLCGLAGLTDELAARAPGTACWGVPARRLAWAAFALGMVAAGGHLPRFLGAMARFGGRDTPAALRFSESQMNGLAACIGTATVDVDIPNSPQLNLALLVEFGRRGMKLQWQPESWHQILAYQPWEPPAYPARGWFRLVAASGAEVPTETVVFRTEQYLLLRPAVGTVPAK